MPLRERLKKAFKSSSPNSSLRKSSTQQSDNSQRRPSNVYGPGDIMPRPKYRIPPKKEHKEKLESFNWSNAWRRKSFVSDYSPMGSRMPSRRNSLLSRKSFTGQTKRRNSIGGKGEPGDGAETVKGRRAARPTRLSAEIEAEGDDDVTNVGLSRVQTRERPRSALLDVPTSSAGVATNESTTYQDFGAYDHRPFTEEDLALAMQRSHLVPPT